MPAISNRYMYIVLLQYSDKYCKYFCTLRVEEGNDRCERCLTWQEGNDRCLTWPFQVSKKDQAKRIPQCYSITALALPADKDLS